MWMMPLHLHVNQKSDYDDDDRTKHGFQLWTNQPALKVTNCVKVFFNRVIKNEYFVSHPKHILDKKLIMILHSKIEFLANGFISKRLLDKKQIMILTFKN